MNWLDFVKKVLGKTCNQNREKLLEKEGIHPGLNEFGLKTSKSPHYISR